MTAIVVALEALSQFSKEWPRISGVDAASLENVKAKSVGIATVTLLVALGAAVFAVHDGLLPSPRATASTTIPAPAVDEPAGSAGASETAVLAGGCFWGVQGVFQHVKGVTQAVSGYAGGDAATAQYETVSTGSTGHAESVRITYDPSQVTFG